jgi:4-hydroxy-tetrahydrodipicolinate synthase
VKECTGNDRIRAYTARGVTCWTGNDDEAHDARYSAGAVGVISVTSNIVPGLMRRLMFDGADAALNARLQPLMGWLFAQPNPIGLNTALAMLGAAPPVFRLPYSPYGPELQAEGARILTELGVEHCVRGPAGAAPGLRQMSQSDWLLLEQY